MEQLFKIKRNLRQFAKTGNKENHDTKSLCIKSIYAKKFHEFFGIYFYKNQPTLFSINVNTVYLPHTFKEIVVRG